MKPLSLEYLSHSRLSAYRQCSLAFRWRYVDKLKPAWVPLPLAFGSAFHRAVEEGLASLMAGTAPVIDEMVQVFTKELDSVDPEIPIRYSEREDRASVIEQARRMLSAWASWPRPAARVLAVEHDFKIPIAEWLPPLVGRVDLIELHEDHLEILDVKSSRGRWNEDDLTQHAGQLALYEAGLADLVREIGKPVKLGFEVVTKSKQPVVERLYLSDVLKESIDRQVRAATLVLEGVEHGVFIPSPGWACSSCPYQKACRDW